MEQKNNPQQNLIVSILITALVVGFGVYFFQFCFKFDNSVRFNGINSRF